MPCAPAAAGLLVLLAKRVLLRQPSVGGQVPTVPDWPGQWGAIVGNPAVGASVLQAAARTFLAQTGLGLPGLADAVVESDASDLEVFDDVAIRLSEAELRALEASVGEAIAAGQAESGVLAEVEVLPLAEAAARLGPVPPPASGWAGFVIDEVYGGVPPGALDAILPTLVALLNRRTAQSPEVFQTAPLCAARSGASNPSP